MRVQLAKALLIPVLAVTAAGADLDHSRWDAVLKQYVTPGSRVDYRSLKERGLTDLDAYLRELAEPWPGDMSPAATKAALINAYNALTVRWIVSNYPVDSIWSTNDPFKAADTRLNEFAPHRNTARVSAIFKWYAEDFDQAGGLRDFLARFAPETHRVLLSSPEARIEHLGYNWGLNDTSPGGGYSQLNFYRDWARNGYLGGAIKDWFLDLGRKHGVNPIVFGGIYVGAIPFFSLSVAWLIQNFRRHRSPLIPALCASFCLVSAYLYLLIAGKNIPAWVYFFVAGMLAFGVFSTVRKIKAKLNEGGRA